MYKPMKKVIVAKEIKAILEKRKSFLDRSGIKIFTAASNEKTLALHRAVNADLIIARLDTSDITGEALCSLIRDDEELRSVSLIIACPGDEADLERCLQCRANAFISNPIDPDILQQEAHKLLNIAPRTACRIPVRVKLQGESKGVPFTGQTENISATGMLFRSSAVFFEGDAVTCSFPLPGSPRISAGAEIVRVETGHDHNHYGVRFGALKSEIVSAIEALTARECQTVKE